MEDVSRWSKIPDKHNNSIISDKIIILLRLSGIFDRRETSSIDTLEPEQKCSVLVLLDGLKEAHRLQKQTLDSKPTSTECKPLGFGVKHI